MHFDYSNDGAHERLAFLFWTPFLLEPSMCSICSSGGQNKADITSSWTLSFCCRTCQVVVIHVFKCVESLTGFLFFFPSRDSVFVTSSRSGLGVGVTGYLTVLNNSAIHRDRITCDVLQDLCNCRRQDTLWKQTAGIYLFILPTKITAKCLMIRCHDTDVLSHPWSGKPQSYRAEESTNLTEKTLANGRMCNLWDESKSLHGSNF